MAFLKATDFSLHYSSDRGPVRAVDSVSFSIEEPGTALGIIGETGSGKSSLIMGLTRVLPRNVALYDGNVVLGGRDIMALGPDQFRREIRWKEIAVVFQGAMNGFNPVLRIGRQLAERMLLEKTYSRQAARGEIEELLVSVGLPRSTYERFPHELSGGMKQRAAIAMALTLKPSLIILDEPTSALDVSVQAQIMNVLKRLKWELKLSMIFVTHDIALASDLCDEVGVMYAGQIREIGSIDHVLTSPQDPYTQELLASIPRLSGEEPPHFVTGTPPDPVSPPKGCRFQDRCPRVFERCRTESPPLFSVDKSHGARCWLRERLS